MKLKFHLLLSASIGSYLFAYSGGPPDGYAGDPPDFNNCTSCHSSFPPNSGDGVFDILGLPSKYVPGDTYEITVFLKDPGQSRWGFELTVIDSGGFEAGKLISLDNFTQISEGPGNIRDYLKHTSSGTFPGADSASWVFKWIAPFQGTGVSHFYLAGNAANNNGSTSGDYIYVFDTAVPESSLSYISEKEIINSSRSDFIVFYSNKSFHFVFDNVNKNDIINIFITDPSGKIKSNNFEIKLNQGRNSFSIPFENHRSGIYFIIVKDKEKVIKRNFFIVR
jgi:hypothetical protein